MRLALSACSAAIVLSLFSRAALADTMVPPGQIFTSQVWTAAGSPYVLTGDISIVSNVFLVIQPGVTVKVNPGDATFGGFDSFRTEIRVDGHLYAVGTDAAPIVFEAASAPSRTTWTGIRVSTVGSTTLDHITLRNAQFGIYSDTFNQQLSCNRSLFEECQYGLTVTGTSSTFNALEIRNCDYAAQMNSAFNPSIINALVHNNTFGIVVYTSCIIENCTIDSSGTGVYGFGGLATVWNCSITNNTYGVYKDTNGIFSLQRNNVWNNSTANYFGVAAGVGSISANPLYVDAVQYRLNSGSPNIDAGVDIPAITSDHFGASRPIDGNGVGGAQWDIGAVEFSPPCLLPTFSGGPANVIVSVGAPASFSVTPSGSPTITLQWRMDGVALNDGGSISGAHTAMLTINPTQAGDFGVYDCVGTNPCGVGTSSPAALCIQSSPAPCPGNANGDAIVDFDDITAVIANWGIACP